MSMEAYELAKDQPMSMYICDPKLVGKDANTLQFSVLLTAKGKTVQKIKGYTVRSGFLTVPQTRLSKGFLMPMLEVPIEVMAYLEKAVTYAWKESFPNVLFPGQDPMQVTVTKGDNGQ